MASGPPPPVPAAILSATQDQHVQLAMLMGSHMEGGWGPTYGVGDNGTSFGPYQMHEGGALGNLPGTLPQQIAEAQDPRQATQAMLSDYQGAVAQVPQALWQSDPEQAGEQAAYLAERPAQTYYQAQGQKSVDAAYQASVAVLGGTAAYSPGAGAAASGGTTGAAGAQSATLTAFGGPLNPANWVSEAVNVVKKPLVRAALLTAALVLFVVGLVLVAGGSPSAVASGVGDLTGKDRSSQREGGGRSGEAPLERQDLSDYDAQLEASRNEQDPAYQANVAAAQRNNAARRRATGPASARNPSPVGTGGTKGLEGVGEDVGEVAVLA